MSILEWAVIGVLALVMFVISARVMRKGLPTLDEHMAKTWGNMRQTEKEIEKNRKEISSGEQLHLLRSAMEDLVRLDGQGQGYEVSEKNGTVELSTPKGSWKVTLLMREKTLKSRARTLHGKCRWRLEGFGLDESYMDLASLMRGLNERLRGGWEKENNSNHILRRMTHLPQEPRRARRL